MTIYCSLSQVKDELQIVEDDVQFNSELSADAVTGSAVVYQKLAAEGLTVPVVVPQLVSVAAACFAAWSFCKRRDPVRADGFWSKGEQLIAEYAGVKPPYVGAA